MRVCGEGRREGGNGSDLEGGTKHAHLIIPDHEPILVRHEHLERVHSCASIDQCARDQGGQQSVTTRSLAPPHLSLGQGSPSLG